MLIAGLSTGNMIGLSIVAAIFIIFALVSSFIIPRQNPDFPGKAGIGVFAIVCVVLFIAQLAAVLHFGVEKKEAPSKAAAHTQVSK
jgi:hypothetical protein